MTSPTNAIAASRFSIVIDGRELATFSELLGINEEVDPTESIATSSSNPTEVIHSRQLGKPQPPTVTLKRAMTGSLELAAWFDTVISGSVAARRSCSVIMYGSDGKPVAKYWLENAWPMKLEIAGMKVGASKELTEIVTLTCDRLQRMAP